MSNTKQISVNVEEFIKNNYTDYGKQVNFNRSIPKIDGLKPVHRRALMGARNVSVGKVTSTVNVVGAINVLHPFGTASLEQVVADLNRQGELIGEGQFGIKLLEDIPAAATRYTKTGISNLKNDYYFKLERYAPLHEGEVDIEPEYLITPVPYALIYGALNWGFGVAGRTPAFTYESLLKAYEKDNPTLLVPSYGYKLNADKSDLEGLWKDGVGRLSLSYSLKRIREDEFLIYGSGEGFKINLSAFNKFVQQGNVKIINESTNEISIKISRAYRSRVDMNEVWDICERVATQSRVYNILVIKDGVIQTIGMKDWLDITIGKYTETYEKYKEDRVSKLEEEIQVLNFLPEVGKLIEDKTDSEIMKKVKGLTAEIFDKIKRKTISSLRKKDTSNEIQSLEKKIVEVKKEDPDKVIKSYI